MEPTSVPIASERPSPSPRLRPAGEGRLVGGSPRMRLRTTVDTGEPRRSEPPRRFRYGGYGTPRGPLQGSRARNTNETSAHDEDGSQGLERLWDTGPSVGPAHGAPLRVPAPSHGVGGVTQTEDRPYRPLDGRIPVNGPAQTPRLRPTRTSWRCTEGQRTPVNGQNPRATTDLVGLHNGPSCLGWSRENLPS